MATITVREQRHQRFFDVTLHPFVNESTAVGAALAEVVEFAPIHDTVSLWYEPEQALALPCMSQHAKIEAAKRLKRLTEKRQGFPVRDCDWDVEFLREVIIDVEVERDEDTGKALKVKPIRSGRRSKVSR